jgi:general transcription factor 3C polypeptide 5 (transcription factor C subunit 1)
MVSVFPFVFLLRARLCLTSHKVEGIREYGFPQEKEDYTIDDTSAMDVDVDPPLVGRVHPEAQLSTQRSNLRLFPPPIFSRQGIPQNYKCVAVYRPEPISI